MYLMYSINNSQNARLPTPRKRKYFLQTPIFLMRKNENKPLQECHVISIRTQIKKKIWNITLKRLTYGTFHPVCSHRVQLGSTSAASLKELFTHL